MDTEFLTPQFPFFIYPSCIVQGKVSSLVKDSWTSERVTIASAIGSVFCYPSLVGVGTSCTSVA